MKLTIDIKITPETQETYRFYTITTNGGEIICQDLPHHAAMLQLGDYLEAQADIPIHSFWIDEDDQVWCVMEKTREGRFAICVVLENGIIDEGSYFVSKHELVNAFMQL